MLCPPRLQRHACRPCSPLSLHRGQHARRHHHHHQQQQQHTGRQVPRLRERRPPRASFLDDEIAARLPEAPDPSLVNQDLLPTLAGARTFGASDFAALWVTLVISITTFMLAASLVDVGMSWWQGVLTVFVGNLVVLVPMVLNAHSGTKYGIPFPVLARSSFGIHGANLPSLSRALVACGWFGLQTWIGGSSIHQMVAALVPGALAGAAPLPLLGITAPQLACFAVFWALQVAVIVRGIESIKALEQASAPILVALAAALLAWAVSAAGGCGPMLASPSQFGPGMPRQGEFWSVFVPAVTANVGYWATLSLNVPDFARYARSQRAQALGQAVGLPPFMALFSFVGLAVTSATVVIYGAPVTDPVQLLSNMQHPLAACVALFGLVLATLTTNIAANVVAPANALVNAAPSRVSFVGGGLITAALGAAIMPWRLVASSSGFLNFLVAYSVLLGPVVGVVMADYYVVRRRQLDIDGLYSASPSGPYWYTGGWNLAALAAVAAGVAPCLPGLAASLGLLPGGVGGAWAAIYDCAWFVGVAVAGAVYVACMRGQQQAAAAAAGG